MKTTLTISALAALLLTPAAALAQSAAPSATPAATPSAQTGAAAAAVPNSFAAPRQTAPARPAAPQGPAAEAPDIARSEEALRAVIASAQGDGFDYSVFTTDLAAKIRQQAAQVGPLIKGFGAVKTVDYVRQDGGAQLFKVTFDNQVTEWLIGFDADEKIAALLFRPAQD